MKAIANAGISNGGHSRMILRPQTGGRPRDPYFSRSTLMVQKREEVFVKVSDV